MLMVSAILVMVLYCSVAFVQYLELTGRIVSNDLIFFSLGSAAVVLHALLLYRWIDLPAGQNLSALNMLSFAIWLSAGIILCSTIRQPLQNLTIFVFPLAALSVVLALLFPGHSIIETAQHPKQLIHILSAVAAFSMLCMAGFQGLLLSIQEYLLRHKYRGNIVKRLPPLETMEHLLFQMVWFGFFLLTLVLISSVYFFHELFSSPPLMQKALLTLAAWIIFAMLLAGRYFFGWRGRRVTYYTLSGVSLLIMIYFSSQLLT